MAEDFESHASLLVFVFLFSFPWLCVSSFWGPRQSKINSLFHHRRRSARLARLCLSHFLAVISLFPAFSLVFFSHMQHHAPQRRPPFFSGTRRRRAPTSHFFFLMRQGPTFSPHVLLKVLCVPSHNGNVDDRQQRHSATTPSLFFFTMS